MTDLVATYNDQYDIHYMLIVYVLLYANLCFTLMYKCIIQTIQKLGLLQQSKDDCNDCGNFVVFTKDLQFGQ